MENQNAEMHVEISTLVNGDKFRKKGKSKWYIFMRQLEPRNLYGDKQLQYWYLDSKGKHECVTKNIKVIKSLS